MLLLENAEDDGNDMYQSKDTKDKKSRYSSRRIIQNTSLGGLALIVAGCGPINLNLSSYFPSLPSISSARYDCDNLPKDIELTPRHCYKNDAGGEGSDGSSDGGASGGGGSSGGDGASSGGDTGGNDPSGPSGGGGSSGGDGASSGGDTGGNDPCGPSGGGGSSGGDGAGTR